VYFMIFLKVIHDINYKECLLATGLDSLELRRLRYDLICTYNVLSNKLYTDDDGNMITSRFPALIDVDVDSLFSFNESFNTIGHCLSTV